MLSYILAAVETVDKEALEAALVRKRDWESATKKAAVRCLFYNVLYLVGLIHNVCSNFVCARAAVFADYNLTFILSSVITIDNIITDIRPSLYQFLYNTSEVRRYLLLIIV